MTIDFIVKIIVFDCYLTKLRLLYVLKTRAAAAGVVSLEKDKVRSCQTAPLSLWWHGGNPPVLQRASRRHTELQWPSQGHPVHRGEVWDRCQVSSLPAGALTPGTHFPPWEMPVPVHNAACSQWVSLVVKTLLGLKGLNFIITHSK